MAFFLFAGCASAQTPAPASAPKLTLFPLDHFWTHTLDAPFAAPPAAGDRRVYVPLQTGHLVAFEPGRTEPVWSVELAADSAPIAAGGKVFVPASGAIHALDAATGTVLWRLPATALSVPLVHRGGWLFLSLADGGLQGVRAADGVVVWANSMGAPLSSPPSVDGDLLALGFADGRIALLEVATGKSRWNTQRSLGSRPGGITLSGDRIFLATDDGFFWSIKTRDGDLDWRHQLGARTIGKAAADSQRVYAVGLDNVVRAFNRRNGHIAWSYPLPTRPLGGPALAEGLVVVTSGDVGAPGLTYINPKTGGAAGKTPGLLEPDETARVQFPVVITEGTSPFAMIATATTSGGWQLHAYRQTVIPAIAGAVTWGKRYEVRRRLDIRTGRIIWGTTVTLTAPVAPRKPPGSPASPPPASAYLP